MNIHAFFLWLFGSFLFFVLEIGHPGLCFFLAFSFGSLAGAFASLVYPGLTVQLYWYVGVTLVSFFLLRHFVRHSNKATMPETNIQALIGKLALVVSEISDNQPGQVQVGGERWRARSVNSKTIRHGSQVRINFIKGATVFVTTIQEGESQKL
ncbi:NfeD family protein [bacterium]|jgi:membrane protein implicated in regulation of membrane protease activity|nr:NfeD family protein [bacterium]MBT3904000.1 NfeD family protein [bacterium]MBT4577660.1 NfeD family protein [bacterium]MBT5345626.1 NfeD family protein [bacterium]MBT6130687.1 NfeD family protein [bacterium]